MPDVCGKIGKVILQKELISENELVLVAVSGGADSLALLHVLYRLREDKRLPFALYIGHLNHGLRGSGARADAAFVRKEAQRLGVPCSVGAADARAFSRKHRLSLEDGARRLRYYYLLQLARRIGATRVAVGHHRDDQVETLLMNIIRGTGLDGLAGMKPKRILDQGITLIRPLLEVKREEIELFCRQMNITPQHDETNLETGFLRNRIRLQLLPRLEKEFNPGVRSALQRLARLMAVDRDFLEKESLKALQRLLVEESEHYLVLDGRALGREHEALQGRVLRQGVQRLLGFVPRNMGQYHVRTILKLMQEGTPHAMLYLPGGLRASRSYDNLILYQRRQPFISPFQPVKLTIPGELHLPGTELKLKTVLTSPQQLKWPPDGLKEAFLDYDRVLLLAAGEDQNKQTVFQERPVLTVRNRLPGDRFSPLGAPGSRKLKKYLIDQKVPAEAREGLPLVLAGEEIIWVAGRQISQRCRVTPETRQVLVLRLEKDKSKQV